MKDREININRFYLQFIALKAINRELTDKELVILFDYLKDMIPEKIGNFCKIKLAEEKI